MGMKGDLERGRDRVQRDRCERSCEELQEEMSGAEMPRAESQRTEKMANFYEDYCEMMPHVDLDQSI